MSAWVCAVGHVHWKYPGTYASMTETVPWYSQVYTQPGTTHALETLDLSAEIFFLFDIVNMTTSNVYLFHVHFCSKNGARRPAFRRNGVHDRGTIHREAKQIVGCSLKGDCASGRAHNVAFQAHTFEHRKTSMSGGAGLRAGILILYLVSKYNVRTKI